MLCATYWLSSLLALQDPEALEEIVTGNTVLESDRVRVLSYEEAPAFWNEWWKQESCNP